MAFFLNIKCSNNCLESREFECLTKFVRLIELRLQKRRFVYKQLNKYIPNDQILFLNVQKKRIKDKTHKFELNGQCPSMPR